jgi:hypothetical protein
MKPAVKYGLITGGAGILWALLMYVTELNRSDTASYISLLSLVITIIFMSMAVNEWRTTKGGGWISFGKAFKQAFIVGLIATIIGIAFHYIYITVIDPSFIEFQIQKEVDKLVEKGLSDADVEKQMNYITPFMTPFWQVIFGFIFIMFMNTVIALIVAGIKKHPNPDEIA